MLKRVVLVTGSSSGIGAALARQLAKPDVGLVLHARKAKDELANVVADCKAKGAQVTSLMGDIAQEAVCAKLVEHAVETFEQLDHLVANAGFPMMQSFADGTREDIEYAFKANLMSLFAFAKASEAALANSDQGRIVALGSFTSSVFRTDMPSFPMSASSKGGVETAVQSLALAFAKSNVTVNCVVPGLIEKDAGTSDSLPVETLRALEQKIPLGRVGLQDEVANVIRFLLSKEASYVTGQSIHVNGGLI